jgi:hypothetical protein
MIVIMNNNLFGMVSDLNDAYGNQAGDSNNPDWEKLNNQAKNILDEYNELMSAVAAKAMTEVRDGICDILVFTLGLGHMAGIPVNSDMGAVQASNLSKFCSNETEVADTVNKYASLGVETYVSGEFPRKQVKSAKEQIGNDSKVYRANKMLKSLSFAEPVFVTI